MAARRSWQPIVALLLAVACDRTQLPPAAPQGSTGTPPVARSFALRGAPGPWWREGANDERFERESRGCLAHSRDMRRLAREDDRADAAYRAFLDCMERSGWRRGLRPPTAGLTAPAR